MKLYGGVPIPHDLVDDVLTDICFGTWHTIVPVKYETNEDDPITPGRVKPKNLHSNFGLHW